VLVLVSDLIWRRVVYRTFLFGKTWFLFTLLLFIISQSVLEHLNDGQKGQLERSLVFGCRTFIYLCSLTQLIYSHSRDSFKAFRAGEITQIGFMWVPIYFLKKWQETASFLLAVSLFIMLCIEPILACWRNNNGELFNERCEEKEGVRGVYMFFSMTAMFLYYLLLLDLAAISTKISSFVLICIRMLSEVGLFLFAFLALVLTFASAISVLNQELSSFAGIHHGSYALIRMFLFMFDTQLFSEFHKYPTVLGAVCVFMILSVFFLLNLLIAQLCCAYSAVYADMVGYARLERAQLIVVTMPSVPKARWNRFVEAMEFHKRLEFNAGDVGLHGGIQVKEAANINPTTVDAIRRFGGSTSKEMQWPPEEDDNDDQAERFDKIERLLHKAIKQVTSRDGNKSGSGQGSTNLDSGGSGSSGGSEDDKGSN
jgi:uncharacterized membrane protein YgcG